ncbi:MAG: phosphomannose isomerase type II C-terminal cupin domain [Chloroflexota bacterium]|nr:phosphomannose isomerase type II C-terminal cupin domain [Chloroflexota bacterium]
MSSYRTKPIPDKQPDTLRVTRPWGGFAQYANNEEVTISLMTVEAGQRLSLQSHTGRAELWIALDDGAIIQVDDRIIRAKAGDEIWIPAGSKHRLGSAGETARVLEVAFGDWRQEDIRRYEDDYDRPAAGE